MTAVVLPVLRRLARLQPILELAELFKDRLERFVERRAKDPWAAVPPKQRRQPLLKASRV